MSEQHRDNGHRGEMKHLEEENIHLKQEVSRQAAMIESQSKLIDTVTKVLRQGAIHTSEPHV